MIRETDLETLESGEGEHNFRSFSQRTRDILERARQAMNFQPPTPEPLTRPDLPPSIAELLSK